MRSSFMGLEVQKRSIQMAQKNLDITGHNLGNIGTAGFTRQRVDVSSLSMSSHSFWQTPLSRLSLAGQGVTAFGVSQIRNEYLDKRYRDMVPIAREHDVKLKIMSELETTLDNIDNFGLTTAFNQLKAAMERVSLSQPDAREMTSQVRNQVVNICQMLRTYHTELTRMLEQNVEELHGSVRATNDLIDKIVQYNKAITNEYLSDAGRIMRGQGVSEYGPLELLDQRNLLLDELAQYGNIEVFQNNNGSVRVTMAGKTIIDDQMSHKIVMHPFSDFNAAFLTFSDGVEFNPKHGELKAYMDMVNGNGPYSVGKFQNSEFGIPYYLQALDAFAAGFAELMNQTNRADLDNANSWDRTLIFGGYEFNANGTPRMTDLLDTLGNPVIGEDGNVIQVQVRSTVSAANIRISDEWEADELLIGQTFLANAIASYALGTHAQGRVIMDPETGFYYRVTASTGFDANSGDTITGALMDTPPGLERINVHRQTTPLSAFSGNRAYNVGELFVDPITHVVHRVTTAIPAPATGSSPHTLDFAISQSEVLGVHEGNWQAANLDGSNLQRFVRALETPVSWGRAMDFNGSVFEKLMFLSDRLATGLDFVDKQFRMTMDTVNTLLDNRDAISGVSETEEGINMLTYQKWFNASARLMTTMDEALDTIINRMGRVGL
jgi:flagellar hook-associated protein FlgK